MNIKEVVELVHCLGSWQNEKCYETVVDRDFIKNKTVLVYNRKTYGFELDREKCYDTVYLDINSKGMCRIDELNIGRINSYMIERFPWIIDPKYYNEYLIDLEDDYDK